jgi:hypothetical protein
MEKLRGCLARLQGARPIQAIIVLSILIDTFLFTAATIAGFQQQSPGAPGDRRYIES